MILLRSVAYQIFLVVTVVFFGIAIAVSGRLLPYRVVGELARIWARANLAALKYICRLNYRIVGIQHLPKSAAIVVCKHQSAWETIALRKMLPINQTWIVKRELLSIPVFGSALRQFAPIAIDRSAGLRAIKQLIREGIESLRVGNLIIIFPEGTRVPIGSRVPYSIGGALLAERTGHPVIPIAHNAGVFWGRRSLIKYPGTIDIVVGSPIVTKERTAQEINKDIEEWIEATASSLPQRPTSVAAISAS